MNTLYSRPECQHDYQWSQDYILQEQTPEMREILTTIRMDIEFLLPEIGIFADYSCAFVEDLEDDILGRYIDGTVSHPYVALNWNTLISTANDNDVDIYTAISSTIVHELGHAIQEALSIERETQDSEDQAERLAEHWYNYRTLAPEFRQLLHG